MARHLSSSSDNSSNTMSINTHITPREYLKHFTTIEDLDLIWRYDKQNARWERLSVSRVGQRRNFYSPEEESRLAEIEYSASFPFNQLREGSELDDSGRAAAGKYLATMIARTERARLRTAAIFSEEVAGAKSDSGRWAMEGNVPEAHMLNYLDEIDERLRGDPLRTKEPLLLHVLELPEILDHIIAMNWQVFMARSPERFLTSDHPVFVGKAKGLKRPDGEFLFPLASQVALVGSWRGPNRSLTFSSASSQIIKKFNRYVVSGAERWLYFHEPADWVTKVVRNPSTKVGREPW